jgi:tetratricopeptide (TPR) repeat protein
LGWVPLANAQGAGSSASRLFAQGEQEFAAAHFVEAAHLFEEADAQAPHPKAVFNAAICWDQAGELARAADGYLEALGRGGLDEKQSMEAEARIDALRGQLGFIQITKPVGGLATVAHKQREPVPTRFYLSPGEYKVLLESAEGSSSETPITAIAGETLRVELTPPATEPATGNAQPALPPQETPAKDSPPQWPATRVLGWVGVGLGVVAAGAAVYMGSQARDEKRRYQDSELTPHERNEALDRAGDMQLGTNLAWAGAGVLGGAGLVLVLVSPRWEF